MKIKPKKILLAICKGNDFDAKHRTTGKVYIRRSRVVPISQQPIYALVNEHVVFKNTCIETTRWFRRTARSFLNARRGFHFEFNRSDNRITERSSYSECVQNVFGSYSDFEWSSLGVVGFLKPRWSGRDDIVIVTYEPTRAHFPICNRHRYCNDNSD